MKKMTVVTEYKNQQRPEMLADRLYEDTHWGEEQWESVSHLWDWISPNNTWIKKTGYRYYQALAAKK